jgi:hypothetical protein
MKLLSLILLFFPIFSFSQTTYETSYKYGIWKTTKKELSGVGFSIVSSVTVEESKNESTGMAERKVSTSFQNCKNIVIPDDEKSRLLKNGEHIRFKMSEATSCNIGSWEKLK